MSPDILYENAEVVIGVGLLLVEICFFPFLIKKFRGLNKSRKNINWYTYPPITGNAVFLVIGIAVVLSRIGLYFSPYNILYFTLLFVLSLALIILFSIMTIKGIRNV
jgi:ABC-type polysaccharide/polyol phosphate export permease